METQLIAAETVAFDPTSITDSSLGDVADYGVFARTYDIDNDMEANVAVQNYVRTSYHTMGTSVRGIPGNDETYNYIEVLNLPSEGGLNWPSEWTVHAVVDLFVIGDTYDIFKGRDQIPNGYNISGSADEIWYVAKKDTMVAYKFAPFNKVTKLVNKSDTEQGGYSIDFNQSFDRLEQLALALDTYAKSNATGTTVYDQNNWDQNMEGLSLASGLNVFNIPAEKLSKNQYVSFSFKDLNQADTVIINVDMQGYDGAGLTIMKNMGLGSWDQHAGKILWNFGSYSGNITLGEMRGTVLAPHASVVVTRTSDGSFIADYVKNTNGELHKNDFIGTLPFVEPEEEDPVEEEPEEEDPREDEPEEEDPQEEEQVQVASATPPVFQYTLTLGSTEGGLVSLYEGTQNYFAGFIVTGIVPLADEGFVFTGFTGDVEELNAGSVTMFSDIALVANFEKIEADLGDDELTPESVLVAIGNEDDQDQPGMDEVLDVTEEIVDDELPEAGGLHEVYLYVAGLSVMLCGLWIVILETKRRKMLNIR